ncbi:hypothetical protein NWP21_06535 [Anabaenopsis sp. FSS-46]|uniref:hypothetical protein n=1 Tax=Anabaenopsis sp. FSS-46 TaxID=2971766 RepID=UPI0024760590|nr:hypothetical protein [Anabaenopsis sp. FSS-46]MDH6098506.1 hypothetical protein [Anabaenopsis sp. FSS-46]
MGQKFLESILSSFETQRQYCGKSERRQQLSTGTNIETGWVSGDNEKQVSVSNQDWKQLGQFSKSKVRLI